MIIRPAFPNTDAAPEAIAGTGPGLDQRPASC